MRIKIKKDLNYPWREFLLERLDSANRESGSYVFSYAEHEKFTEALLRGDSVKEIADQIGTRNKSAVRQHIKTILKKIESDPTFPDAD